MPTGDVTHSPAPLGQRGLGGNPFEPPARGIPWTPLSTAIRGPWLSTFVSEKTNANLASDIVSPASGANPLPPTAMKPPVSKPRRRPPASGWF
jgi:hypothetical protein